MQPALAQRGLVDQRYRIVRWIGQGACASVYEAHDLELDRPVAIKVMNAELITSSTIRKRFLQEAEAAVHIDSPFVVVVHAVGTLPDDRPYIVMELLEGEDLDKRLAKTGVLDEQHAVELAIHALSGLAHAHARGVLHRDVKPANLVLVKSDSGEEVLKIVDLGISKVLTTATGETASELGATKTNVILGSPVYMSPEQCRGAKNMDHRSDVYAVGVVLYECLTGHVPHTGDNVNEIMFKIALEDAPHPSTFRPEIDADLAAIMMKALARDPDQRFPSASAFREALLEWGAERGARILPTPSSRRMVTATTPSGSALPVPISSASPSSGRLALVHDDDRVGEVTELGPESRPAASGTSKVRDVVAEVAPEHDDVQQPEAPRRLVDVLEEERAHDRAKRTRLIQRAVFIVASLITIIGGAVLLTRRPRHAAIAEAATPPPTLVVTSAAPPPLERAASATASAPTPAVSVAAVSPAASAKGHKPPRKPKRPAAPKKAAALASAAASEAPAPAPVVLPPEEPETAETTTSESAAD